MNALDHAPDRTFAHAREHTTHRTLTLGIVSNLLSVGILALAGLAAQAEPHHGGMGHANWGFDNRFNHNHYYPTRGYVLNELPLGSLSIGFGAEMFYFQAGVWFRPMGARFVVVQPPVGIVIPTSPPGCAMVQMAGQTYCYANGVYYAPTNTGAYAVAAPPAASDPSAPQMVIAEPVPTGQPVSVTGAAPALPIAYPRNGQNVSQARADQTECSRWASSQASASDPSALPRGFGACMDAKGYTVR